MGLEIQCRAHIAGETHNGKLHVDSKEIAFTCRGVKWSHPVGTDVTARVVGEILQVGKGSQAAGFELGEVASRWLDKVCNPSSRMKKLGIRDGSMVFLSGDFADDVREEIAEVGGSVTKKSADCSLALAVVESTRELTALTRIVEALEVGRSLWIVWPKGVKTLSDTHVIAFAREFGMGPGKSCSFDDRLTAMRFTRK